MDDASPDPTAAGSAPAHPALVRVRDLRKSYRSGSDTIHVLRGLNLDLHSGGSVALTGESGSGKSTLLHLIAALDAPDSGTISFSGEDIASMREARRAAFRRTSLGLVFQQFNLIPSLSVGDNLAFQARLSGRFDAAWQDELASRLGLSDLLQRYPEQLSGGQQQRVAIGRALASRPQLVLADEPTGNLDEDTADAVLTLVRELVAHTGCAFLMVTHSERLATTLDRHLHLSAGRIA